MEKIYLKNEKLFKSKWQMLIYIIIFIILIWAFIYLGTLDYNDDFHVCQSCQSLNQCPKDTIGMQKILK